MTPDTFLAWHRKLFARKWDYSSRRRGPGRPRVMLEIIGLVVRMAKENPKCGYTQIRGALANLDDTVARGTIANILKGHGIEPTPQRGNKTSWSTFLKAHRETLAAIDFLTVEISMLERLVTYYVLIFIELSTRRVHVAGITPTPDSAFMMQVGRNLTDPFDGFLLAKRFLIMDRDKKFTEGFRRLLDDAGTRAVRLPPRSPNLNAYVESTLLRRVRPRPAPSGG